jgi:hypothetical protein
MNPEIESHKQAMERPQYGEELNEASDPPEPPGRRIYPDRTIGCYRNHRDPCCNSVPRIL